MTHINSSWQLVTTPATHNSNKIEALQYLNGWQCLLYLERMDWFKDVPYLDHELPLNVHIEPPPR